MFGKLTEFITAILTALMRLPLLDFVPRGYLTKASGYLQVVVGLGLAAQVLSEWMDTGKIPEPDTLENVLAVLLMANGAAAIGQRRAIENVPK